MNNKNTFLVAGIILILLAGVIYTTYSKDANSMPVENETAMNAPIVTEPAIVWNFSEAPETNNIPHTTVTVTVNGTSHTVGTFAGSCAEIGATGGIDSKGLLAGELSAAQCWYAGGGDEIGVFAEEDGGRTVMVGELGEGEEGMGTFRGNFKVRTDIQI